MKIDPKLVEQWASDCPYPTSKCAAEYIAQRAADHALEEAAKVCEGRFMGDMNREDVEVRKCAAAIRELKGTK